MADPIKDKRKPGVPFTASEARDALVKKALEAERSAFEARTAKLRALRLAKEAADAAQAVRLAAEAPVKKTNPSKKTSATKTR
jgi:hypothetical protein